MKSNKLFTVLSRSLALCSAVVLVAFAGAGCQSPAGPTMSIPELKAAANAGDASAAFKLGDAYFYGRGVDQNYAEAEMWYKKATQGYQQR